MMLKIQKKNKKQLTKKKSNKKSNKRNRKKSFKKKLHLKVKGGGPNYSLRTGKNYNYEITYFGKTGNPNSLTCNDSNVNKKLQEVMCENLTDLLREIQVEEPIFKKKNIMTIMTNKLLFEKEDMLTVKKIAFVLIVFAIYSKIGPFFTTFNQRNNIKVYFKLYSKDESKDENPVERLNNEIESLQKKNIINERTFFLGDNSAIIDIKFNKKNSYDLTGSHFPSFLENCMNYSKENEIFQIIKIIMEQIFTEFQEFAITNNKDIEDQDIEIQRVIQRKNYLNALLDNIFEIVENRLLVVDKKKIMEIFMHYHLTQFSEIIQGTSESNSSTPVNPAPTNQKTRAPTNQKPRGMFSFFNNKDPNNPIKEAKNLYDGTSQNQDMYPSKGLIKHT